MGQGKHSVTDYCLESLRVSVSNWLRADHDPSQLYQLLLGQFYLPRCPILFQTSDINRAWDGNHALRGDPGQRNLSRGTAPSLGELLNLIDNGLVLVEILSLELWDYNDASQYHAIERSKCERGKSTY